MRLRTLIILVAIISLFTSVEARTKRALVIGIGQYPAYTGWRHINGDKDVPIVKSMLLGMGFKSENIGTLTNSQASKANIINGFSSLVKQSKPGDIIYIHYSGHGQQMRDGNNDEQDGLDESWIPYDACKKPCSKDRGEKHLVDDEIGKWLTALSNKVGTKGKVLVVADACHSGDSDKEAEEDDSVVYRGTNVVFDRTKAKASKRTSNTNGWILISACSDLQRNAEMRTPKVGKLTYAISKVVQNGMSNQQLQAKLNAFFASQRLGNDFPQTPQISNKNLYTISDIWGR